MCQHRHRQPSGLLLYSSTTLVRTNSQNSVTHRLFVLQVSDPYWPDVSSYGYQTLQPHQDVVIQAAEQQLDKLRAAMNTSKHSSSRSC